MNRQTEPGPKGWPGQAELLREPGAGNLSVRASDSPGNPDGSLAVLQAAQAAFLNPRSQLRSAVALQIGQLNELSLLLGRLEGLMDSAGMAWAEWTERGRTGQEDLGRALADLTEAKRGQEALVLEFRRSLAAAKDEDTARLESGLRNLAAAAQELRTATETVAGAGRRFQDQVQGVLRSLERSVPEVAGEAGKALEIPIRQFLEALRPLMWIGGTLGVLVAADLLVRVLK